MKVIKVKNYEELSRTAATIIAGVILSKPDVSWDLLQVLPQLELMTS